MPTHGTTLTYKRNSETISKTVEVTADGEINLDISLTASQADKNAVVAVDVSAVKSLFISGDVAFKIEWNNNAGAQGSLTLAADTPIAWHDTMGVANPLGSTDITGIYVTNLDAAAGTVKIRILQDVTP